MYVSKPGDVVKAKAIGTYPELPDTLDTVDLDPAWFRSDHFIADRHFMVFGGPKGVVVASIDEDGLYSVVKDGTVIYETDLRVLAPEPRVRVPYVPEGYTYVHASERAHAHLRRKS